MFSGCVNLKTIIVSDHFDTSNLSGEDKGDGMFTNCTALVGGRGTVYDPAHTNALYARVDRAGTPGYFTKKSNTIKVSKSVTKTASASSDHTFALNASSVIKGIPLNYSSNSSKVTVSGDGKVTIKKGFAGSAVITVKAAETEVYLGAEAKVSITVKKVSNTIKVSKNLTKTANTLKAQTFMLNASANGAPLKYKSSTGKVTVTSKGKVTIKKGFAGKAVITVTAKETGVYLGAVAKVNLTVKVTATKLSSVKWKDIEETVIVTWKKNTTGKGYELQFSQWKDFRKIPKKVKIGNNKTVNTTVNGLAGGTWYVRVRTVNGTNVSDFSKALSVRVPVILTNLSGIEWPSFTGGKKTNKPGVKIP